MNQQLPAFEDTQPLSSPQSGGGGADALPAFEDTVAPGEAEAKYGTMGQQLLTAGEGLAQGVAGPVATAAELGLSKMGVPGLSAKDQVMRGSVNSITHGVTEGVGLIGGMATGTGEAGLLSKVAEAAPLVHTLAEGGLGSKVASGIIKGGLEAGLFQGGDEATKGLLGEGDPEEPVSAALINMGAASLFGAATGGLFGAAGAGLAKLGDTELGAKMSQFAEDFGKTWEFDAANPDMVESVARELSELHGSVQDLAHEAYGANGLKNQAIDKLSEEVTPEMVSRHVSETNALLDSAPSALKDEKLFQEAAQEWRNAATPIQNQDMHGNFELNPQKQDVFKATDKLKRQLQEWGVFNKINPPSIKDRPFVNASKDLSRKLRLSLEDTNNWGKLGTLQRDVNKATHDFIPKLADYNSKFAEKIEKTPTTSLGKVNTYLRQEGEYAGDTKKKILGGFVNSAKEYRSQISKLYGAAGVENPISALAMPAVDSTLKAATAGAGAARFLRTEAPRKIAQIVGEGGGVALGGTGGFFIGKALVPYLTEALGRPITQAGAAALLKVMASGSYKSAALALSHAGHVNGGVQKMNRAISGLFSMGAGSAYVSMATEKHKEKIKKFLEEGGLNEQTLHTLQEQKQDMIRRHIRQQAPEQQFFAKGGYVEAKKKEAMPDHDTPSLGSVYPNQDMLMQAAKGRVFNYLNSIRPRTRHQGFPMMQSLKIACRKKRMTEPLILRPIL